MSRAGVIAAAASTVLVIGALAGRAAERRTVCPEGLVPAYLRPEALLRWIEGAPLPSMLIVNPASGPGAAPDAGYERAIAAAQAAGSNVLGYVPTTWGARSVGAVEADVDRYRAWYGVDGVFFDEAARDAATVEHYRALAAHARAAGAPVIVLNPGVVPARGYFDIADVVVTFEGSFAEYERFEQPDWLDPARSAHLVYGASEEQALRPVASSARVYVTTGTLPHPWGTVPRGAGGCT